MSRIKIWQRVPDQSVLEVRVEADAGATARARVLDSEGQETNWKHGDLVPGPKSKTLRTPKRYATTVTVDFAKQATAKVHATLKRRQSDGTFKEDKWTSSTLSASQGSKSVSVLINTLQS